MDKSLAIRLGLLPVILILLILCHYFFQLSRAETELGRIAAVISPDLSDIDPALGNQFQDQLIQIRSVHPRTDQVDALVGDIQRILARDEVWVSQRRAKLRVATNWYESALSQSPRSKRNWIKFAETRAEIGEDGRLVWPLISRAMTLAPWDQVLNPRVGYLCVKYWQGSEDDFRQACRDTLKRMSHHAPSSHRLTAMAQFRRIASDLDAYDEVMASMDW